MKDFILFKKVQKKFFHMPSHQTDVDGFKSDLFLLPIWPIRTNDNQLHMRSFVGMHSAALIPLKYQLISLAREQTTTNPVPKESLRKFFF